MEKKDFDTIKENERLWLPEFNSCSIDLRVAKAYAKTHANQNDKVAVIFVFKKPLEVIPIMDNSNYPGEKEVIVTSWGKDYRVTQIEKKDGHFVVHLQFRE